MLKPYLAKIAQNNYYRTNFYAFGFDIALADIKKIPGRHHKYIADRLQNLANSETGGDVVINIPPGSGKTLWVCCFVAWLLGNNPRLRILLSSVTIDRSEKSSRFIKSIMSSKRYREIFPGTRIAGGVNAAVQQWLTTRGGGVQAAGIGKEILGFRLDWSFIDDPIGSMEDADSPVSEQLWSWFKSKLSTRFDGPGGKQVLICQRLGRNDLAGRMFDAAEEPGARKLEKIVLPAICEEPDDDVLGRAEGELLWPEHHTPEFLANFQRDDLIWRTMFQQRPPSEEGSWVHADDIQFRDTPAITSESMIYGASDLAVTVNGGDYSVHVLVSIDEAGDWDIVHCQRKRCDPDTNAQDIVSLCSTYHPREWYADDDLGTKNFQPLLHTEARAQRISVPWKLLKIGGKNKEVRASALRGQFKRRKVYMPANAPFTKWLVQQILMFPNGTGSGVDDGIDALSLLGRRLAVMSGMAVKLEPKRLKTTSEMCLDELWPTAPQMSRSARI